MTTHDHKGFGPFDSFWITAFAMTGVNAIINGAELHDDAVALANWTGLEDYQTVSSEKVPVNTETVNVTTTWFSKEAQLVAAASPLYFLALYFGSRALSRASNRV